MKISEYQNEEALEILADIIEPAGEIMADKEIGRVWKENRLKSISLAIKNHKSAVIEIMARLDNVPVSEYKCNIFTLPIKLLEILNDPYLAQVFSLQGQMEEMRFSVSAMGTTEEN